MFRVKQKTYVSSMDDMMRLEQKTVYRGTRCSVAEAIALQAYEKKQQRKQTAAARNEYAAREIYQKIISQSEKTFKTTRTLKSLKAFYDNGPVQWYREFPNLLKMFPTFRSKLLAYCCQYAETYTALQQVKNPQNVKTFFKNVETFGASMCRLKDLFNDVVDYVCESHMMTIPGYSRSEIIAGSKDGKRLGLRQILSMSTRTSSSLRTNIIELQRILSIAQSEIAAI